MADHDKHPTTTNSPSPLSDSEHSDSDSEEKIDPSTLGPALYSASLKNHTAKFLEVVNTAGTNSDGDEVNVPIDYVDMNNNCKWTCLQWGCYHGNVVIVEELLKRGAAEEYVEARRVVEEAMGAKSLTPSTPLPSLLLTTPLHLTTSNSHLLCTWSLLPYYSLTDVDSTGNTPLHLAAQNGNVDVVLCLLEHGADANAVNTFMNKPLGVCVDGDCRVALKEYMAKPRLNEGQRKEIQSSHFKTLADLEEGICNFNASSSNSISSDEKEEGGGSVEELIEKLVFGKSYGVSTSSLKRGESIVCEMHLTSQLKAEVASLRKISPIVSQSLYVDYVNVLKKTISDVQTFISAKPESSKPSSATPTATPTSTDATSVVLSELVTNAQTVVITAHNEYWLTVTTSKVLAIKCATESSVRLMFKLKLAIDNAKNANADAEIVNASVVIYDRLVNELELIRTLKSIPTVKLPVHDMEPKQAKEHWLESDPEKPVNIGHIEEGEHFPLPGDDGQYAWVPSVAYVSLKGALDRLNDGITQASITHANVELLERCKSKLSEVNGEFKVLEGKNGDDRDAAVAGAEKAAKKLKKANKGGKKGKAVAVAVEAAVEAQ